jgi:hypothetical protein
MTLLRSLQSASPAQANGEEGSWAAAQTCALDELMLPRVIGYASELNENLQRPFMRNAVQYFDVMTDFPRSAAGKTLKREMREPY